MLPSSPYCPERWSSAWPWSRRRTPLTLDLDWASVGILTVLLSPQANMHSLALLTAPGLLLSRHYRLQAGPRASRAVDRALVGTVALLDAVIAFTPEVLAPLSVAVMACWLAVAHISAERAGRRVQAPGER